MTPPNSRRVRRLVSALAALAGALVAVLVLPGTLVGQVDIRTAAEDIVTISRGSTAIITRLDSITRISIADPDVAEPVVIPPNQVLINARNPGSTSLVIWGMDRVARMYTIAVTADVAALQRQIEELFPDAGITVTSTGSSIVLNGEVRDAQAIRKAIELAETMGIPIVNNIQAPSPEQILLHVEFAEVSKDALKEMGRDLIRVLNPQFLDEVDSNSTIVDENGAVIGPFDIASVSEGIVSLLVSGERTQLNAILRALKTNGNYYSLAQPNLVTREGQPATFLAGGEFPFPVAQRGEGESGSTITIMWKEFGIRLNFLPEITNSGNIRLQVMPEVSSLDFTSGLQVSGFSIPTVLARRVETDVELRPGQTLAIGGLMDNTIASEIRKFPLLGDIPILGYFFRSENARQNRTELLVLVTPYILDSDNLPAPPLPTGPASEWDWDPYIGDWIRDHETRPRLGDPVVPLAPSGNGAGEGR